MSTETATRSLPETASCMVIHDNGELQGLAEKTQAALKWRSVRAALDAVLTASISYLTEPTGQQTGNFPLFSYAGYSGSAIPDRIRIKQNKVQHGTLSEFLHLFKRASTEQPRRIEFEYVDRRSALKLLAGMASLAVVTERFGSRETAIDLGLEIPTGNDAVVDLMTENHGAGLSRLAGHEELGARVIAAKHAKHSLHPGESEGLIRGLITDIEAQQFRAPAHHVKYLNSLIVALRLDLAYVLDRTAPQEVMAAMSLARQIGDPALVANCQRFANQCLDMTPEAFAMLEASCRTLGSLPAYTEENGHILPSYYGAISNRNTTALTLQKGLVDPKSMEDDYWEAKTRLPTYHNLALLANAAGVAYLTQRKYSEATRLMTLATNDNAEYVERLNAFCNLLIAQWLECGDYDGRLFEQLLKQLVEFDMGPHWEYLRVRILLNLSRIANNRVHRELSDDLCRSSSFWTSTHADLSIDQLFESYMKSRFSYYFEGTRIKGAIGEFIEMNTLFPAIDKDYM